MAIKIFPEIWLTLVSIFQTEKLSKQSTFTKDMSTEIVGEINLSCHTCLNHIYHDDYDYMWYQVVADKSFLCGKAIIIVRRYRY